MRADRLLSILMLLQTKGRMTAHDLADQLEVSERTIYRDLEALGIAGIPIYTERGPGGGCALIDGYQTRLTGLNEAEIRALFLLNQSAPLADLGLERAMDDALLKLLASLPAPSRENAEQMRQRFYVDTTWWYHTENVRSCLQTIQQAVWQDHRLCLIYQEDDGRPDERLVEPYGLVTKAGVWYLVATSCGGYHVFRVSRILTAEMTEETFVRSENFNLASYWTDYCTLSETNDPLYSALLRLAPDEAPLLPETLSAWGYTLVESEEAYASNDRNSQVVPLPRYRARKEKKMHPHSAQTSRQSYPQKENLLFALNHTGEWMALPPKEKNGNSPLQSGDRHGQKEENAPGTNSTAPVPQKKENWQVSSQQKKRYNKKNLYIKKRRPELQQKNGLASANKKSASPLDFKKKQFSSEQRSSTTSTNKKNLHVYKKASPSLPIQKNSASRSTKKPFDSTKKTRLLLLKNARTAIKKTYTSGHIKKQKFLAVLSWPPLRIA